jgi:DNA invertase Pin-like site-specific DNA recombinase
LKSMAKGAQKTKAFAYLRTSSAANVGADKDSDKRQRDAVQRYAKSAGFDVVAEYFDAAVTGADALDVRPGFSALLDAIETNGVCTVLIEDASRFARELLVQEAGILALHARGVTVLTAGGDNLTETNDPYKFAMRQIAGVFAQLEKARLVAKLRHARERKRAEGHKVEGRKSHAERNPEVFELAKRLRWASPKTGENGLIARSRQGWQWSDTSTTAGSRSGRAPSRPCLRRSSTGVRCEARPPVRHRCPRCAISRCYLRMMLARDTTDGGRGVGHKGG